ncbi:MAG: sigma-70 family RNA polymerase sigma factor [Planctomycetota bacterium]|nr:sigma-70 family RNA polymerase sigma factor [Planctomycetota bacterium]
MSTLDTDGQVLLERLRTGDERVLGDLFALYRNRLWRIVHFRIDRRLSGRVDADDILQEAYLAAADRLSHYLQAPEKSFFIWLRLIVTQTMVDVHRRHLGAKMRDARRDLSINDRQPFPMATSTSLAAQLLGQVSSPSQIAMRDELAVQLEKAIHGMEPIDQEVLALRHYEELTNSEVAEVMGIQQKAASIRYVRALKRLKDILEQVPGMIQNER